MTSVAAQIAWRSSRRAGCAEPEVSTAIGEWHRLSAIAMVGFGVACAAASLILALSSRGVGWSHRLIAMHAVVLVLLCWAPGLSFSLGPKYCGALFNSRRRRASWCSLGLFWLGAISIIGAGLAGACEHGLRHYLFYFESRSWLVYVLPMGQALVATAMGINGWLWLSMLSSSNQERGQPAFLQMLAVAGFVHLVAMPLAWALPIAMLLDRHGVPNLFSPERGGDPSQLARLYWLYVQPVVLTTSLPLLGFVSDNLARMSGLRSNSLAPSMRCAVATATLGFFFWATRAEAALSEVVRNFYAFASLFGILLLGQPFVEIGRALVMSWREGRVGVSTVLSTLLSLLGLVALAAVALPSLGLRLQGTPFETAQFHLMAGGVVLLTVAAPLEAQDKGGRRTNWLLTVVGVSGATLMTGTELYSGLSGWPVPRFVSLVGGMLLAFALTIAVVASERERHRQKRAEAARSDNETLPADSERFPQSNIA